MFGATVLVPILTGLDPATALATAGIGTLLFHLVTKMKVPVFLGSSFAFIPGVAAIVGEYGIAEAQGGIIIAGAVYLLLAVIIYFVGVERVKKLFPPIVTGSVIIVIGIGLSYSAINDMGGLIDSGFYGQNQWASWLISFFVVVVVVVCMCVAKKGFFKLVPILIGLASGYVVCALLSAFGLETVNWQPLTDAAWFNLPYASYYAGDSGVIGNIFTLPKFDWTAILTIAPLALITFMEHIGDITTNGKVVGEDFLANPGLHRTVLGDGIATAVAGFFGGPANTTYSENTGVLATTKNYDPRLLRLTALFAIALALFGKFGAILQTIPGPVKGGIGIVLFGMIASVGIRTLIEAKIDLTKSRNLLIIALILGTGLGINIATYGGGSVAGIPIQIGNVSFGLSGLFVATIVGILANLLIPKEVEADSPELAAMEAPGHADDTKHLAEGVMNMYDPEVETSETEKESKKENDPPNKKEA
jgi:uracil permease